jgi:ribosomal protein L22
MPVPEARTLLQFSPRDAARDVSRLIDSAAANAEANHDLVAEDLQIAEIYVDEGPTLKRWRARARGRAARIDKKTSHLSVVLTPTTD